MNKSIQLKATQFANMVLLNKGKLAFEAVAMPANAQLTNYRAVIPFKHQDQKLSSYLLLGNFGYNNIEIGKQDADFGTVLQWSTRGPAQANLLQSLLVEGEVRNAAPIRIGNQSCWILAKNNGALQVLKTK